VQQRVPGLGTGHCLEEVRSRPSGVFRALFALVRALFLVPALFPSRAPAAPARVLSLAPFPVRALFHGRPPASAGLTTAASEAADLGS